MALFSDLTRRNTRANQPAASAVSAGTLYYVTDESITERSNGAAWEDVSDAAASGGLTLLEQHTAAGSASLDFTTAFTSAYDEYLIEGINLIPATNGVLPWIRFSTDGGASYDAGANYQWATSIQTPAGGTGFTAVASATGASAIVPSGTGNVANTAIGGGLRFSARLFDPLSAAAHKALIGEGTFRNSGDSNHYRTNFGGYYASATAINALRFLFSSGNITSGTIRIYGLKK